MDRLAEAGLPILWKSQRQIRHMLSNEMPFQFGAVEQAARLPGIFGCSPPVKWGCSDIGRSEVGHIPEPRPLVSEVNRTVSERTRLRFRDGLDPEKLHLGPVWFRQAGRLPYVLVAFAKFNPGYASIATAEKRRPANERCFLSRCS